MLHLEALCHGLKRAHYLHLGIEDDGPLLMFLPEQPLSSQVSALASVAFVFSWHMAPSRHQPSLAEQGCFPFSQTAESASESVTLWSCFLSLLVKAPPLFKE